MPIQYNNVYVYSTCSGAYNLIIDGTSHELSFDCTKEASTCTDSDDGKNYYLKGTITGLYSDEQGIRVGSWTDKCSNTEGYLIEFSCSQDGGYSGGQQSGNYGWSDFYKCPNGCNDGACLLNEGEVKEQIKCVFQVSTTTQKCSFTVKTQGQSYNYGCSGISECSFTAAAPSGTEIVLQSGCSGENYVKFDGKDEIHYFDCVDQTQETVKEQVKCVFEGSTTKQECYNSKEDGCNGTETCVVNVKGKEGEIISWKSSCGGYASTTMDGTNEYAIFSCGSVEIPKEEPPRCNLDEDCAGLICPQVVGSDKPKCNLETSKCYCGGDVKASEEKVITKKPNIFIRIRNFFRRILS